MGGEAYMIILDMRVQLKIRDIMVFDGFGRVGCGCGLGMVGFVETSWMEVELALELSRCIP